MKYATIYQEWIDNTVGDLHSELCAIKDDEVRIEDAFYTHLAFGTAGLRGVIGAGTNRMNIFTIRRATQGFADFLLGTKECKCGGSSCTDSKCIKTQSVVICYDSRNFSYEFAKETAGVFAANGIKAYIFKTLLPTPICSFAVRSLKATAGVMITASHNPKQYNGYKAYGSDGCQINDEVADGVLAAINRIDSYFSVPKPNFDELSKSGMIEFVPDFVYEDYMTAVEELSVIDKMPCSCDKSYNFCECLKPRKLKIVYSPLNGTGNVPVREILKRTGFDNVVVVPEQENPNGNFDTCPYPNPEEKDTLRLAVELAKKENADLVLATDPDCDRVGIAVKDGDGYTLMSGNDVGILLTQYLCEAKKISGILPNDFVVVRTIVTNDVVDRIVAKFGGEIKAVLTGFKHIGGVISALESIGQENRFLLGFEESYGYMSGAHVRDKDAVNACMLIAEMAEYYLAKGSNLVQVLDCIYAEHGYFKAVTKSIAFPGASGLADMKTKMNNLQNNPPTNISNFAVIDYKDYNKGIDGLPTSNVLVFSVKDAKVIARPSGTEPKLKIYILAHAKKKEDLDCFVDKLLDGIRSHIQ